MFVEQLNLAQQNALLFFTEEIIKKDGVIDTKEEIIFETIKGQCSSKAKSEYIETKQLPALFDTKASKYSFLFELVAVAHADEEYHAKEKELIDEIGVSLSIPVDKLSSIESWVFQQFDLMKQARSMMEEQ